MTSNNIIAELDAQARNNVTPVNPNVSPKEYFAWGASQLKEAGNKKKLNDLQGAYLHLMMYFVLIMERIPAHPHISQHNDEYYYNCERCAGVISTELKNLREQLKPQVPQKSSSSWFSVFGGSSSTSSAQKKLPPTPNSPSSSSLPPVPRNPNATMQEKALETVVMNERVQESVGRGVANMAANEQVQAKVGDGIANAAQDRKYQKIVGKTIAENSDNALVKQLASNESVQQHIGTAVSKTVGNKEVQKKVGTAIASAATNKEVQRKVANGFLGAAKLGWGATKAGASLAVKGSKMAYDEYSRQQEEEKRQQQQQ